MRDINYRYFLAFLPDLVLRCELARLRDAAGQFSGRVKAEHLHLTLCVIAELAQQNRLITREVEVALARGLPPSCLIRLGKIIGGSGGAAIHTIGSRHEIQVFYKLLLRLLAEQQILPMHRKSGLHPHVTLGYDPSDFESLMPWEWIPRELVLIESELGRGVHNVLRRWPLLSPSQGRLPFEAKLQLPARRAGFDRRGR